MCYVCACVRVYAHACECAYVHVCVCVISCPWYESKLYPVVIIFLELYIYI